MTTESEASAVRKAVRALAWRRPRAEPSGRKKVTAPVGRIVGFGVLLFWGDERPGEERVMT